MSPPVSEARGAIEGKSKSWFQVINKSNEKWLWKAFFIIS